VRSSCKTSRKTPVSVRHFAIPLLTLSHPCRGAAPHKLLLPPGNAIQAFGNGTDVNLSPKNPSPPVTLPPKTEKSPALPDDINDSNTMYDTSVITTCTSVQVGPEPGRCCRLGTLGWMPRWVHQPGDQLQPVGSPKSCSAHVSWSGCGVGTQVLGRIHHPWSSGVWALPGDLAWCREGSVSCPSPSLDQGMVPSLAWRWAQGKVSWRGCPSPASPAPGLFGVKTASIPSPAKILSCPGRRDELLCFLLTFGKALQASPPTTCYEPWFPLPRAPGCGHRPVSLQGGSAAPGGFGGAQISGCDPGCTYLP